MPPGWNSRTTRQKSSRDFCSQAYNNMGTRHALTSLVYLVGVALLFSLARAEFWQEKTPETERLEHGSPVFESSVI